MFAFKFFLLSVSCSATLTLAIDDDDGDDICHSVVNRYRRQEVERHKQLMSFVEGVKEGITTHEEMVLAKLAEITSQMNGMKEGITTHEEMVLAKLAEITSQMNDMCPTHPDSRIDVHPTLPDSHSGLDIIPYGDISFSPNDPSSYKEYVDRLNEFIEPYENATVGGNVINCFDNIKLVGEQVCLSEAAYWLDDCRRENDWGFKTSSPCVVMTYHNHSAFEPEIYTSMDQLPDDIPLDLKNVMEISTHENDGELLKVVWVYCTNAVAYAPYQGFYYYYFPNKDLDHYLPPIVAVAFDHNYAGDKVEVECSMWDITTDKAERTKIKFTITKTS